jgi:Helix-turn-helix domain
MTDDDTDMTTTQVAELLHMTEGGLRWWRHVGRGPFSYKSGRRTLYPRKGVMAWREQNIKDTGRGEMSRAS